MCEINVLLFENMGHMLAEREILVSLDPEFRKFTALRVCERAPRGQNKLKLASVRTRTVVLGCRRAAARRQYAACY
jgi:hypothetical protein